jgi:hypothetical protein
VDDASNLQRQEALKQEVCRRSLTFLPGEGQHPANGWPAEPSVWPPEPTCRDLAGLEILMGFWLQAPFSQPIQV